MRSCKPSCRRTMAYRQTGGYRCGSRGCAVLTISRQAVAGIVAVGGLLLLPHGAGAMDIVAGFTPSITNNPNSQQIEASIETATSQIGALFSNPGTVNILFAYRVASDADDIGQSFTQLNSLTYSDYTGKLTAASTANPDNTALATAVANLPNGNDANGSKPVELTTAMQRVALGDASATPCYDAQGQFVGGCNSIYDGVIVLNRDVDIDFTRPIPVYDGTNEEYDAIETEEHEIDEILGGGGWGSTLGGNDQNTAYGPTDLYRYSAPDTGSHTPSPNASSYLSIDGGQTAIIGFSQYNDGSDYGDWGPDITTCSDTNFVGGPGYVQDTDSCNNKQSDVTNASPEFTMLEALGYEPSTAALQPVIAWNCNTNPDATNYTGTLNAIKEGSCTQIVTGDSTFTGGTNIDTGTLQLGNGGGTGSVTGDIIDSGTLVFDHSNTVAYAGVISGGGALKQIGSGTLILTGDNTYTGLTTIALGAALQLGDGGTTGSIAGDIVDHGTLIIDRISTVTYGGTISAQGNVELTGGGTLIFTGDNTYTGGTTIDPGNALEVGDGGTDGSFKGAVTDNGTLAFDHSDTVIFKAQISGTGTLAQTGSGTTIFTAANSYTGGTIIRAGTLQIGNGKTTGMIEGNVLDDGTLAFDRTDNIGFASAISGGGAVQQLGSGTLTLTGNSSYSGGTSVGTGTLEAGKSSALGTGTVTLNGTPATLVLDNSVNLANAISIAQSSFIDVNGTDSATLSGVLSGSAPFEKDGTGTLALTGNSASTYSGDISFHGTLSVGATGALGSGTVTVLGSTLVLADGVTYGNPTVLADDLTIEQDAGSSTVTGPVSSNGAGTWGLTKTGAGTLTLANTNSFVGQTVVQNGLLVVSGVLPGDVTVDSGASLAVTGTVGGNVTVLAGGSMTPFALGHGFAKATLASYSETGSTLSIRFGGSSASFADDELIVPGAVALNGGTLDPHPTSPAGDYAFNQRYLVIDAPAIAGSFDNPSGFVANAYDPDLFQRVRYDLGGVVLEVRRPIDFNGVSGSANQHAAAGAINSTEMDASDDWAALINNLSQLSPADQARALSQISGEGLMDATRISSDDLDVFDESLRAHTIDIGGPDGGRVVSVGDSGHIWVATLGRDEDTDSHAGYSSFHTQVGAFAFGADAAVTDALTLGVAASVGHPSLDVPSLATAVTGRLDAYGAYGRYDFGAAYVSAAVSSDVARLHEHRTVSFGSVTDDLSAPFHQSATLASAEVDVPVAMLDGDLEPFLRVAYLANRQGGFQEADGGADLGLSVAPFSHENWTETAGGRWRHTYQSEDIWFAPEATAGLAFNTLEDVPETAASLEGAPANTGAFSISAARAAPLAGIVGAGIAAGLESTPIVLHLDYEGRFSNRSSANSGLANLSYSW